MLLTQRRSPRTSRSQKAVSCSITTGKCALLYKKRSAAGIKSLQEFNRNMTENFSFPPYNKNREEMCMFSFICRMYENRFFSLLFLMLPVLLFLAAYEFGWKSIHMDRYCSAGTTGRVTRYLFLQYSEKRIAVVAYQAGGRNYEVNGPEFTVTFMTGMYLPYINRRAGALTASVSGENSVMVAESGSERRTGQTENVCCTELSRYNIYPLGSTLKVYYNPKNPWQAYTENARRPKPLLFWLPVLTGTALSVFNMIMYSALYF